MEEQVQANPEGAFDAQEAFANIIEQEEAQPEVEAQPQEEPEEPQEQEPEESEPEALIEITVKGEGGEDVVEKVTLQQLQSGYMMQKDYQRKTAEIARQRETLQNEIKSQVEPVLQRYENNLNVMQQAVLQAIGPELQNVNWKELAVEDPAKYVELTAQANHIGQILNTIAAEQQKIADQKEQQRQQELAKAIPEAVATLERDIPGWNNTLYQNLLKTGVDAYGFSPKEIGEVYDARMIKVLHDAHKYRELQKAKPNVDKKVVNAPKVLKPGAPISRNDGNAVVKEKIKQVRKTGRVEDAAAAFNSIIFGS